MRKNWLCTPRRTMLIGVSALLGTVTALAQPPYIGTIFLDPDILTANDPSAFVALSYVGQGTRIMFDRRVANFVTLQPYLFNAIYDDGLRIEIQVNPEFGSESAARVEAQKYARVFGRLPHSLRTDVKTSWIHRGKEPFGGGNNNLLIHTGMSDEYEAQGILEETLIHEASHSSLDAIHGASPGWVRAQGADPEFISTYARDNPTREDIAETYLTYLALRHRPDRVSNSYRTSVSAAIPNRIAYFDQQPLNLYPMTARPAVFNGTLLTLSAVSVGSDRYTAQLALLSGNGPLTFVLRTASLAASYAPSAASFTGGNVVIPEVAFNGSTYSAELVMTSSAPMTFVLRSYVHKY